MLSEYRIYDFDVYSMVVYNLASDTFLPALASILSQAKIIFADNADCRTEKRRFVCRSR